MTDDLIERAEAAIERALHEGNPAILLRELIAALKAARARNTEHDTYVARLVDQIRDHAIDLNTTAQHLNAVSLNLRAVFPSRPGQ